MGSCRRFKSALRMVGLASAALWVATAGAPEVGAFTTTQNGWVCVDSEETTGFPPQFVWDDISFQGFGVGAACCDNAVTFFGAGQPPWAPAVMGTFGQQLTVNSNGYCQFPAPGFGAQFLNDNGPIPSAASPTNGICGWWDNLLPFDTNNHIRIAFLGNAPQRRMVLAWLNVPHAFGAGQATVSFQIVLYEEGNAIKLQYQFMTGPLANASGATVGINNFNGTAGIQYVNNGVPATNNTYNNLAVGFHQQGVTPPWPAIPPPPPPPPSGGGSGGAVGPIKDESREHSLCGGAAGADRAGVLLLGGVILATIAGFLRRRTTTA